MLTKSFQQLQFDDSISGAISAEQFARPLVICAPKADNSHRRLFNARKTIVSVDSAELLVEREVLIHQVFCMHSWRHWNSRKLISFLGG